MGVLALAALAAAGPLIGRGGAKEHWPTDVSIVLDNSASTGRLDEDRLVFEKLRQAAAATIELAGPADRFWIFPTVGGPLAVGVGAAEADRALRMARSSDGYGDIGAAISRAVRSLPSLETASGNRTREVHLLSDLQATGFPVVTKTGVRVPLIVYRQPADSETNDAITAAGHSEGVHPPSGAPLFLRVDVERFPRVQSPGDSGLLRLEVDGSTIDAATATWGESTTFRVPALDAGSRYVSVEIEPSGLRADDARHLAFRIRDPPPLELFGQRESFLALAIQTLRDAGRVGRSGDAVRFLEFGPDRLSSGPSSGLPGAVVYIPPDDPIELPRLNQWLAEASVPWALAAAEEPGALELASTGTPAATSLDLDGVRVFRRHRLISTTDAARDSALIRTSDGSAWLVRGETASSTYLVLASPLLPSASTLPTSATMVPFVERLLQWSYAESATDRNHLAGEIVAMPDGADSIRTPNADVRRVDAGTPVRLEKAGLYRIYRDGEIEHVAANVPGKEHDPSAIDPDSLPELFPELQVVTAGPGPGRWTRQVFRSRRGRDASSWIIGIVGLLVLIETLVATPGTGNRKAGS
jgi:hypothetical protein